MIIANRVKEAALVGPRVLTKDRLRQLLACLLLSILFVEPCWSQSGTVSDWRRSVAAQVRANVHLPPGHSGPGGEAEIEFRLDRLGNVSSAVIRKSSGLPELDQAAIAYMEKTHFPPAPPEVGDSDLDFVAPFVFVSNEWLSKIRKQLLSHLRVPPGFTNKYAEVWVDFTIDRSGKVLSKKLVRSAGVPELATAALAAVEAAQPFPVPFELDESGLTIPAAFGAPSPTVSDIEKAEEKVKARLKGICRGC